jgi:hypothetical protein
MDYEAALLIWTCAESATTSLQHPVENRSATEMRHKPNQAKLRNSKTQKLKNSKTQKLKNSKTRELRNSGTQELRNSVTQ